MPSPWTRRMVDELNAEELEKAKKMADERKAAAEAFDAEFPPTETVLGINVHRFSLQPDACPRCGGTPTDHALIGCPPADYCPHGVYVGGSGPDYMCGYCEEGVN